MKATSITKSPDKDIDKICELTVAAEPWKLWQEAQNRAKAAQDAAEAAWLLLGLPKKGEDWKLMVKAQHGERVQVIVRDGNNIPLSSGILSERTMPPQPERTYWVAPKL